MEVNGVNVSSSPSGKTKLRKVVQEVLSGWSLQLAPSSQTVTRTALLVVFAAVIAPDRPRSTITNILPVRGWNGRESTGLYDLCST